MPKNRIGSTLIVKSVFATILFFPATSMSDNQAISLICTATDSIGFAWNADVGRFERVTFEKRKYLVTSANHDETSCIDERAICLNWRDVNDTTKTYQFRYQCFWSNKGDENERLMCTLSNEILKIDLKRGVYTYTDNSGPALFGPLVELMDGDPESGFASELFVEHGVCNRLRSE